MIQRLLLTPSNHTLIGRYNPKADSVHVMLNGEFDVELPSLYVSEQTMFYFYNIGNAEVTLITRSFNGTDVGEHIIYPGDSASCVDSLSGTWLLVNTRSSAHIDNNILAVW